MTGNQTILITGVTGNQGGVVAQALQGTGFYLRGLTRTPDSERSAALARQAIDIVKGDLDDEATLLPGPEVRRSRAKFSLDITTLLLCSGHDQNKLIIGFGRVCDCERQQIAIGSDIVRLHDEHHRRGRT